MSDATKSYEVVSILKRKLLPDGDGDVSMNIRFRFDILVLIV